MPSLAGNLAGPVPDKLRRHLNRENVYILVVAHPPGIPSGSLLTALAEQKSEMCNCEPKALPMSYERAQSSPVRLLQNGDANAQIQLRLRIVEACLTIPFLEQKRGWGIVL